MNPKNDPPTSMPCSEDSEFTTSTATKRDDLCNEITSKKGF